MAGVKYMSFLLVLNQIICFSSGLHLNMQECSMSCDFEDDTTCAWQIPYQRPFAIEKWTEDSSIPKPAQGVYYLVNSNLFVNAGIYAVLPCTSGSVSFSYFVSLISQAEDPAMQVWTSEGLLYEYTGTSTGGWLVKSLDFSGLSSDSPEILITSSLIRNGDIVALDNLCVICGGSTNTPSSSPLTSSTVTSYYTSTPSTPSTPHTTNSPGTTSTPPYPEDCYSSCDFEDGTQCDYTSEINSFTMQVWNQDLPLPKPMDGSHFLLNSVPYTMTDLEIDLSCDSGAATIQFKAFVHQHTQAETTLEIVGSPTGSVIIQFPGNTTDNNWQDLTVEVHPFHKATKAVFQSRLMNPGDVVALDDFCISTCCDLFCDFENGICPDWTNLNRGFAIQNYAYHTAGLPQPAVGKFYQINFDSMVQKDSEVTLPCTSGTVTFKLAVQQKDATDATLQIIMKPSGVIIYKYLQASTDGRWQETSVRFDVRETQDTEMMFVSTLLNSGEYAAMDDTCFLCDPAS